MTMSKTRYVDLMTGLFFTAGILSFVSGQFVLSTLLFGAATLTNLIYFATPARA